jgi:hypothetical protein
MVVFALVSTSFSLDQQALGMSAKSIFFCVGECSTIEDSRFVVNKINPDHITTKPQSQNF